MRMRGPKAWGTLFARSPPGDCHLKKPYAACESDHNVAVAEEFDAGQASKNQVATHLRKESPHRVVPKDWNRTAEGCRSDVELVHP